MGLETKKKKTVKKQQAQSPSRAEETREMNTIHKRETVPNKYFEMFLTY